MVVSRMVEYYFSDDSFVIKDYQNAKKFCSFLPALAGEDGKPLWAFFANVGQCMGGFGANSKDTPMTPFDSAVSAYQNIPSKSFRTFIKIDGVNYQPFFDDNRSERALIIKKSQFSIVEKVEGKYEISITYSTVSHRPYAGLIRLVKITNLDESNHQFEMCDGLPIFFPLGLSNYSYKELSTLMSAYCLVDLNDRAPFVKYKSTSDDNSIIEVAHNGNGFVSFDKDGHRLDNIVDNYQIFEDDVTLISPKHWNEKGFDVTKEDQILENQLPCAFSLVKRNIAGKEEYGFATIFGSFNSLDEFNSSIKNLSYESLQEMIQETEDLVDSYLPKGIHTSNRVFDEYIKQSVLDNNLRGGFPVILKDGKSGQPYYLYSRKHGDMERDYNAFVIPSKYYSSGPGNFRDVNQNRRSDLYFVNKVDDYNIKLFFSLIQVDGQNPLTVKPLIFKMDDNFDLDVIKELKEEDQKKVIKLLDGYYPGDMYDLLLNCLGNKKKAQEVFEKVLGESKQEIEATYGEGYWIDHWTYNVDLLENYRSVFPDKMEELLFEKEYPYFYSLMSINPRSEKCCLVSENTVRQYGAIDTNKFKVENEKAGYSGKETLWLKDQNGKEVKVSLASKIFNLILVKFSTLDAHQMGIEMECEKPGWNDALNGLPGLFASSMCESIELLRLINFALEEFKKYDDKEIALLDEQFKLMKCVNTNLDALSEDKISAFKYWDNVTNAREELRANCHFSAQNSNNFVEMSFILSLMEKMKSLLSQGINKAKGIGGGIIPTYFINRVSKFEKTGHINHLGFEVVKPLEFTVEIIPPFLEASARLAKLGEEYFSKKEYELIYQSDLRDQQLGSYKTCANIDSAPFEIGRIRSFSKGWLERECNFLHMTYKYLLGLLKAGLYEDFYKEFNINFVCNMNPNVYGRSPIENSSFIVPTCNPNRRIHGQGQYARLTGANAEVIDIFYLLFLGEQAFTYENEELVFAPAPKLSRFFFDENDEVSYPLFNSCVITIHNPDKLDLYKGEYRLSYIINDKEKDSIKGIDALNLRRGVTKELRIEVRKA